MSYGNVVVDHMADAVHVQAAGRHVGGDEDVDLLLLQPLDGALAQLLLDVAVERRAGVAAGFQLLGQFGGGVLGAHEDQDRIEGLDLQDAGQRVQLVGAGDLPVALGGRRHGRWFCWLS